MKIEIEIPVADLKAALPGFSKIISRKTSLPVLGCLKVQLDENEELVRLSATNLDETVEFRINNEAVGFSGELLVPFDELTRIVKGCSAKQSIRLLADEKKTIIRYPLGDGFVDQPVETFDVKEWPTAPKFDGAAIPLADGFKETLKQAIDCASTDSSRHVLNGACIDVSGDKGHYVVGTDGAHLFAANSFQFNLKTSALISRKRFLCWDAFVQDGSWYLRTLAKTKDKAPQLRIDSEHWSYLAAQIDGNFPNWKQVIPVPDSRWTNLILEESAVKQLLGILPMLPGRDLQSQPVELEVRGDKLFVKGKSKNGAASESQIDEVKITGQPVEISLDRNFLLKALRFGFRNIDIENPSSPLLFTNAGKTLVVMPVRGEAAERYSQTKQPKNSPAEKAAEAPTEESKSTETERKTMPEETFKEPPRGNLKSNDTEAETAIDELLEKLEDTKSHLREFFGGLNEMTTALKKVAREKKETEKEINKFRASLRSLQKVEI